MKIKTTKYFREQVLRKRPYIKLEWCEQIVKSPMAKVTQLDKRIRHWGQVVEFGNRMLRVVTLLDGITIHNAFPDRSYQAESPDKKEQS